MGKLEVDIYKKMGDFELRIQFGAEDEILALLGASGCGKSMTLKCIAGIETPDSGKIVLNNKVLFDSKKKINLTPQKRNVGYMFQDYALFPNMTVQENILIAMWKMPKNERQEAGDRMMERFHIMELKKHYPDQLSGGQKQRVAMARMLAARPEIILLDEPFSALDSYLKWELEQEMKDTLNNLGKTTLFVSHNRDEVYRLCDTVSCINAGKTEKKLSVKEFFHNPKSRSAAMLSGCKNISSIQKIDDYHLYAQDWDVKLMTDIPVSDEIRYVGIRAHCLKPIFESNENKEKENLLKVEKDKLIEDPFEWNFSFKKSNASKWIQWKIAKENRSPQKCPVYFEINKEDILLLTD